MSALARWWRARPVAFAALLYAVLALVFVSQSLLPGRVMSFSDGAYFTPPWSASKPASLVRAANPELGDAYSVLYPQLDFDRAQMPDVPLWNPSIQSGRPFLADGQSALFSPFTLPTYVLGTYDSLAWVAALKLFLAAFGLFLLSRALGVRPGGALVGGVVYGFNLWMVEWLVYPHSSVWALLPWLLLAGDRVIRRPAPLEACGLAAMLGLVLLCGHPESEFQAGVALVVFAALRMVQLHRRDGLRVWPRVGAFAAGGLGGLALAALVVLPFLELLQRSADVVQRAGTARHSWLDSGYLLAAGLWDYWGHGTGSEPVLNSPIHAFYAGALALLLVIVAVVRRPRWQRSFTALIGAGALCVVFGAFPVFEVVTRLPLFSSGHNSRLIFVYMLCVALLAAWGVGDLLSRPRVWDTRTRWALGAGAVALALPAVVVMITGAAPVDELGRALKVAWGFATPPPGSDHAYPAVNRMTSVVLWLPAVLVGAVLVWARASGRLGTKWFVALAVLVVAADLFRAGMGYNPSIPESVARQPATPAIRFLQAHRDQRFAEFPQFVPNMLAMNYGLQSATGYDLPIIKRYDTLWRTYLSPEYPTQVGGINGLPLSLPNIDERRIHLLRMLGVGYLVEAPGELPIPLPGLKLAYEGPDARIYRITGAAPRAAVVGAQQVTDGGPGTLLALGAPRFDAGRLAITERRLPGVPAVATPDRAPRPAGAARIIPGDDPDRVRIVATARRNALLVLSDVEYPGWKATVDGREVPISRVNYALRAVPLPPGTHRVDFRYEPLSWTVGWIVSLVALVVIAAVAAWDAARRRRAGRGAPAA